MADLLIYLIAGEESGDLLGGRLMTALKRQSPEVRFAGIGGARMQAEGLVPLFPMHELSVMGLVEVLRHAPALLGRIRQTTEDILSRQPAVVVTIDAPDFSLRVSRRVAKKNPLIRLVHYVAPSVWAWRPGRARKIAGFLHHLLALLPFEPPYFTAEKLPCTFVGHPAVESQLRGDGEEFRTRHRIDATDRVVLLLPGSRQGEVTRLLPLMLEVAGRLREKNLDLRFVIPTLPHLQGMIAQLADDSGLDCLIVGPQEKLAAFATARAALAASGTVALELGLAGVPTVICYRVNSLTAFIARQLVRVKYASLINLIVQEEIMPEFLQERATADRITPALAALLSDSPARQAQIVAGKRVLELLTPEAGGPSDVAARVILNEACRSARVAAA